MSSKRSFYTASYKLKVVAFAENSNNSEAARKFSVNEKQVREWRKMKDQLKKMPKTKKAARYMKPAFPELEVKLVDWIQESRQNGFIITRTAIRMRALNLAAESELKNSKPANFVASVGWCNRFMQRHNLCIRARTKIAQKLPEKLESSIQSFQRYIIEMRKKYNFELSQIGNMDETPVSFDLPTNYTVDNKGAKTVCIKTTGHEKTRFTVVLCCMADGTRLPPTIIFKRKKLPKKAQFPSGVLVRAQEKGWMDESGILEWLEKSWNKRRGAALKKHSLLVWDSFRAHLTDNILQKCKELKTTVAVIPGGLTSMLQPLDVSINKPFKDRLRRKWIEWMTQADKATTKAGNLKKVDIVTIAGWVKEAWLDIPSTMIEKSFKKCCISNAMDGTEDDMIYEENDDSEIDENNESEDEMYPDVAMTECEFNELFCNSDSDSEFEGFQ